MVQETQAKDQRVTMLQLGDKLRNKHKDLSAELKRDEIEHVVIKLIVDSVLLEKIIGKFKTEKYGDRILEEVMRHDAASEHIVKDPTKEGTCESRSRKRAKTQKDVVLVESSNEEEA